MLPGLGVTEIIVIGIIALLVVGPKDLPLMMRKLGQFSARMRAMANEFRSGFDELARQAELEELRREVDSLKRGQVFTDIEGELMRPMPQMNRPLSPPPADEPPSTEAPAGAIETPGAAPPQIASAEAEPRPAPETPARDDAAVTVRAAP